MKSSTKCIFSAVGGFAAGVAATIVGSKMIDNHIDRIIQEEMEFSCEDEDFEDELEDEEEEADMDEKSA